ncbi:MAG: gliding motility protein GldN [Bacteroidales bacterium]|jgi:gliding motility associated protien GldN|nr:gliding motility protein GldN [Bacteroidales bacterium]
MKKVGLVLVATIIALSAFAQSEYPDSPYDRPHTADRKPIALQTIRYADVMWSKKLERMLPLRERMNHPLYFPNNEAGRIGSRYSFTALTISGVNYGYFQAYDAMADGAVPISAADFDSKLGALTDTIQVEQEDGSFSNVYVENKADPSSIKFLIFREEWMLDKQRSVMEPRIMWITFLREYERNGEVRKSLAFKIFYPSAQALYARNEVFNPRSDVAFLTFYDILLKRMFSSFISRESNQFNDREINSYMLGIEQLYEAERLKDNIFRFEHDLWEF